MLYRALFALVLRRLEPELAHRLGFGALRVAAAVPGLAGAVRAALAPPPAAAVEVAGVRFPGRFGLAAGFDKEARGVEALSMLGFAFVEVGTITAHPQPGNERPRLWRETAVSGLRNAMGFNNAGAEEVAARLRRLRATARGRSLVVGVNIGKSRVVPADDEAAVAEDYATTARALAPHADYLVVNVSSPNTPGLRDLQAVGALRPVLRAVQGAVAEAAPSAGGAPPLLVKIAPDLTDEDVDAVADLVTELGLAGVVAVNTTIAHDLGRGGLSGPPLLARGLRVVARLRERLGPGAVVVGVGGVTTPDDALAYLDAGADLVQGYTGFVYQGPRWAASVNRALVPRPGAAPAAPAPAVPTAPTVPAAPTGAAAELRTYLGADPQPHAAHLRLPRPAAAARGALTAGQREVVKVAVTRAVAPWSRARAARLLRERRPLLLNVGSGTYNAPGWVNIDLWGLGRAWGVRPDLLWDLRRPLPFPDGSADAVFTEHVLEHLPAPVGLAALERWWPVLRPGGVVRVSVPDAGRYLRSYAGDASFVREQRPGRPTPLTAVTEVLYHHGHRSAWDGATLVALLEAAGYVDVAVTEYGRTAAPRVPDSPHRAGESLYVEGRRPG